MRIIATLDNNPLEKEAFSDLTLTEYEAENIVKEKYYEKGKDESDYLILSVNIPFSGEENNENEYDDMIDLKRSISDYTEEELKELGETYLDEIYSGANSNDSNVMLLDNEEIYTDEVPREEVENIVNTFLDYLETEYNNILTKTFYLESNELFLMSFYYNGWKVDKMFLLDRLKCWEVAAICHLESIENYYEEVMLYKSEMIESEFSDIEISIALIRNTFSYLHSLILNRESWVKNKRKELFT